MKNLEKYNPDVISVESMPPSMIEYMYNHGGSYKKFVERRLSLKYGKILQDKLSITRSEANHKADSLLRIEKIMDEERKKLIQYFVANYDIDSAILQFSYLPKDVQDSFSEIPGNMLTTLRRSLKSQNEIYSIPFLFEDYFQKKSYVYIYQPCLLDMQSSYNICSKISV